MYCVYCHNNKINNKKYIGITKHGDCPNKRWKDGKGYNNKTQPLFYRAIKKYGWDNFEHTILKNNLTQKESSKFEYYFIHQLYHTDNFKYGYNCTTGGELNYTVSQETKNKMSIAMRGNTNGHYAKGIAKVSLRGKPRPDYVKKKISEAKKGKPLSQKNREALKGVHKKKQVWNKGKKNCFSEETKNRISKKVSKYLEENNPNAKKVRCLNNNRVYNSIAEIARNLNLPYNKLHYGIIKNNSYMDYKFEYYNN